MLTPRLANVANPGQDLDRYPRTLCCCRAGLLRSPTAALVLATEFGRNTRSAGLGPEALVPVDEVLLAWADEVVVMEDWQADRVRELGYDRPVLVLEVPDRFRFRDPELVELIRTRFRGRRNPEGGPRDE